MGQALNRRDVAQPARARPGVVRRAVAVGSVIALVAGLTAIGSLSTAGATSGPPAFVQQAAAHSSGVTTLSVTPPSAITTGNRLVVEAAVWNASGATISNVTDSAANAYAELTHFTASEGTELSIWTAPITKGGGSRPSITATSTSKADVGVVALEYSGLSTVADSSVVDQMAHATGTTGSAATVASGATPATTASNELAVGFYADSGFGDNLTAGAGYTGRTNVSPAGDMELLAEDSVVGQGATPSATVSTGANTVWLMATVVLRATQGVSTPPAAPTSVVATPGNASASVNWTAPFNGGSPITSYTVTPYVGTTAQTPTVVTGSPPASTATVTSLLNGTAYTFTVAATNAIGPGVASAPSNSVVPSSVPQGQWSSLQTMPIVALSSILLNNGNILSWDGWQQPQPSVVWNPATPGTFTTINAPDSVFCDGAVQLPDGRVVVVGGYGGLSTGQIGIVDTNIFDPSTSKWTRVANMRFPRWYPSLTQLADGRLVAISGNSTDAAHWADTPEVYNPGTNTWTSLSKVSTSQVHEEEYPFSYLAPNGKVFTIGPAEDKSFFLDVANQTWTAVGGQSGILNGSSVMYQPGKILYTGGAADINNPTPAQATSAVIDLTAATPTWQQIAPMAHSRVYHMLTMLADGRVMAVGGETTSDQSIVTTGVLQTEIWDPATQTWSSAAPIAASRNYHSTSLLMPDGRVLITGGGHPLTVGDPGQFSSQMYSPSYLFNGPRPTIGSAPPQGSYASTIPVSTPDAASIKAVNLVSLGADTHQSDMTQHFVPLSFTTSGSALNVQLPSSAALAPPGNYMLFIVNASGVPSTASMINIAQTPTITAPAAPTAVNATAGNASAAVSWTAPSNGGSPITSYTVTPYIGTTAQTPTTISGTPPATTANVTGLTNGTTYTFAVAATNGVGPGPASANSNPVTPTAPTAPGAPTAVNATAGNASATVSWTAPSNGGNPITSYTVTPYVGTTAQTPATVSGTPPATNANITGLTNGTTYTFAVTATNGVGTGPPSAKSNAVTPAMVTLPAFVQQASAHGASKTTLAVTPSAALTTGNRVVVEVSTWGASAATVTGVTDSAGDTFVKLTNFTASDTSEMSVWSAPITAGGGTRPTITATTSSVADIGVAALEYSGLSTVADATVLDQSAHATGTAASARAVSSGSTPATTLANELAIGLYADSGFSNNLTSGPGYTARANVSPVNDIELLAEDTIVGQGANPAASVNTGAGTIWLMATLVLKPAIASNPTAPGAPTNVVATAGDASATVSWTAPPNGGSPITSYTITPYIGSTPQSPITATAAATASPAALSPLGAAVLRKKTSSTTNSLTTYTCVVATHSMMGLAAAVDPATNATVTGLKNGTTYTFVVTANNAVGSGPASANSNPVTPTAPTAPSAPTAVNATAGSGSATVTWTAPSNGGSAITSYTVTPYIGTTAQPASTVTGTPPATIATISGLTNGTTYTLVVTATNGVGTSPPSSNSNAVTPSAVTLPAFVQKVTSHTAAKTSLAVTPTAAVTTGNRLVVEVATWSASGATVTGVSDSAGNTFVELTNFTASDATEMSVWSAPVTAGGGTRPTLTARVSTAADIGVAALEYSGLSTVANTTVVDQSAHATGTTGSAQAVSSGGTLATTQANELAIGLYADSGFGNTLTAGPGYTARANVSPVTDMELLAEDSVVGQGAKPAASVNTGAGTIWLMATLVLKTA